jgi:hypothetical protein
VPSPESLVAPRVVASVIAVVSTFACSAPPLPQAENPFVGNWVTTDNASIIIRSDTIVQHLPNGESITLGSDTCRGDFRFSYGTKSRQALTALVPRQPELRQRLTDLLVAASYPVLELDCDRGDQTYVLLNNGQLVAIYRDGDIGAIDRLARR